MIANACSDLAGSLIRAGPDGQVDRASLFSPASTTYVNVLIESTRPASYAAMAASFLRM